MGGALTSISGPNQFIFGGTIGDVVRLRVETAATLRSRRRCCFSRAGRLPNTGAVAAGSTGAHPDETRRA